MTIRLSWPAQTGLDAIEIYRKVGYAATLDPLAPGAPYKTLAGNKTEFIEAIEDLTEKTIYVYWIAAVKGSERLIGAPVMQGYYLDTGPGPQTLLRGDWAAGYFGAIPKEEFFTQKELLALVPKLSNVSLMDVPTWHKFVFRGRIVFYPSTTNAYGAYYQFYTNGIAQGTSGEGGTITPSGYGATNQLTTVDKNGRRYSIRLPYLATANNPASSSDAITRQGEWRNTMCRLIGNTTAGALPKFSDLPALGSNTSSANPGSCMMAAMTTNSAAFYAYGTQPDNGTQVGYSSSSYAMLVLELQLP